MNLAVAVRPAMAKITRTKPHRLNRMPVSASGRHVRAGD